MYAMTFLTLNRLRKSDDNLMIVPFISINVFFYHIKVQLIISIVFDLLITSKRKREKEQERDVQVLL